MKIVYRPSNAVRRGLFALLLILALYSLVHNIVLSDTGLVINDLGVFTLALAPVVAAGLISGLSSLLGSGISFGSQREQQDKQNRANREMADYQYGKDLQMWRMANAFNSPTAQMSRLQQAGLNPNLAYGSGSVAGNTTSQLPKYQAPQMRYDVALPADALPSVIGQYQDYQMKSAQIDNLREQKFLTTQKVETSKQALDLARSTWEPKTMKAWEDAYQAEQKRKQSAQIFPYQLDFAKENARKQQFLMDKLSIDTELQRKKTDWYVTKLMGDMLAQSIRGVTQILPPGRMGKASGKLSPGTLNRERYNSPSSWERMLQNR